MYIGSKNPNSTTGIISKELIKKIEEPGNLKTKVFYYSGADSYIEECRGCTQCFISGKCALDQQDDMKYIRQKMLEADCIILGSPVYFHAVSGNMKNFIDRLSFWTHTMELAKKPGIVISCSGGNGLLFVSDYLNKFMDYLGIINVDRIEEMTYSKEYMENNKVIEKMQDRLAECAKKINDIFCRDIELKCSQLQGRIFRANNKKYKELKDYRAYIAEVDRWYEKGYLDYQEFDQI